MVDSTAKVSEQVNRKCPVSNYQPHTLITTCVSTAVLSVCVSLLATSHKHKNTVDQQLISRH